MKYVAAGYSVFEVDGENRRLVAWVNHNAGDGAAEKIAAAMNADSVSVTAKAEKCQKELQQSRAVACASAHVIIESGVVPGVDYPCRCDECRLVGQKLDEAGYMEGVKDKWWAVEASREEPETDTVSVEEDAP